MKQLLDRIVPFFPWAGLLLIIAGGVSYIIIRRFDLLTNLLFGLGALLLLLFIALRPDDVRRTFSRRQTRFGLTTLLAVLFFLAIGVLIYWIAFQNPDWRYDATEEGAFTPLPETVELLENLDEPLHIIGFFTQANNFQQGQAETKLESLQAINDRITYEFQDPESNPLLAEQYDLNFDGTLVFIRNRDEPDEVFSKANSIDDNDLHAALIKVVNPVDKKAYFITGHGELDITGFGPEGMGTVIGIIEDQGFEVEPLNLFATGSVPEDATVVALIGQNGPLDPAEVEALTSFVDAGGALFLARDPVDSEGRNATEEDGIAAWLGDTCGITLRNDAIIDQDLAQAGQEFGLSFIGSTYGNHPIITDELRTFGTRFVLARSLDSGEGTAGPVATQLVRTSSNAWGETSFDLLSTGVAQPDGNDALGPLSVGVSCENTGSGQRVAVFGDSDFMRNDTAVFGGNSILFANAMNWLADDELTINLAPRESVDRQVNIPQTQLTILQLLSICLGPLVLGVIGVVVAVSRRNRR